jgi:hypothetical protein
LTRSAADFDELVAGSVALEVKADLELGKVPVFAFDRARLSQVLLNLLKNAWEEAATFGRVVIETSAAHGVARIVVSDDGTGGARGDTWSYIRGLLHGMPGTTGADVLLNVRRSHGDIPLSHGVPRDRGSQGSGSQILVWSRSS